MREINYITMKSRVPMGPGKFHMVVLVSFRSDLSLGFPMAHEFQATNPINSELLRILASNFEKSTEYCNHPTVASIRISNVNWTNKQYVER